MIVRILRGAAIALMCVAGGAPQVANAAATCVPTTISSAATPEILVHVRINGMGPYVFFVDTGATVSIVSSALARKLHLAATDVVHGVGAGGSFATRASRVDLSVGEVAQRGVVVSVFDVSQLEAALGPVDGALGYNFLKAYRATIDFPAHRLCLEEPS